MNVPICSIFSEIVPPLVAMNGAFATDRVQSDSNSLLDGVLSQQTSDTVASNHIFMQPLLHASLTSVPIALVVYPASTTSTWYQHAAVVAATRPYPAFAMHATTAYAVAVNQAAVAAAPVLQTGGSPLLLRPAHLVITAADQHSSVSISLVTTSGILTMACLRQGTEKYSILRSIYSFDIYNCIF